MLVSPSGQMKPWYSAINFWKERTKNDLVSMEFKSWRTIPGFKSFPGKNSNNNKFSVHSKHSSKSSKLQIENSMKLSTTLKTSGSKNCPKKRSKNCSTGTSSKRSKGFPSKRSSVRIINRPSLINFLMFIQILILKCRVIQKATRSTILQGRNLSSRFDRLIWKRRRFSQELFDVLVRFWVRMRCRKGVRI